MSDKEIKSYLSFAAGRQGTGARGGLRIEDPSVIPYIITQTLSLTRVRVKCSAECGMWNAENRQRVKYGKFDAEHSALYPLPIRD